MTQPLESIKGTSKSLGGFSSLDMNNHVKLKSFINIAMPPIYKQLEQYCDLTKMRHRGIVPIMNYLDFKSTPQKAGFFHPIYCEGEVKLLRSITPWSGLPQTVGPNKERLLLDIMSEIKVKADNNAGKHLGSSNQIGDIALAGTSRVMQVFTKPLASPTERQVIDVPSELKVLKEHILEEPFPTVELLEEIPDGFRKDTENLQVPSYSVWGLSNTDANQHVTVTEYIMGFQNHLYHMLFQSEKAVEKHFIHRAQFIFRKPFFPGQCYAIKGQIYYKTEGCPKDQTIMLAGFHLAEKDGKLHTRPSVFTRIEGSFILD